MIAAPYEGCEAVSAEAVLLDCPRLFFAKRSAYKTLVFSLVTETRARRRRSARAPRPG